MVDFTTYYKVFQTKTYISLLLTLPKSTSDKGAAKKRKSLPKIVFFLDVGTTVSHTFPSCELQCLPRGDPRNLCVNTRIRLLATHSLKITSIHCSVFQLDIIGNELRQSKEQRTQLAASVNRLTVSFHPATS